MPKSLVTRKSKKIETHTESLYQQVNPSETVFKVKTPRTKNKKKNQDSETLVLDEKTSRKILLMAKKQQLELENGNDESKKDHETVEMPHFNQFTKTYDSDHDSSVASKDSKGNEIDYQDWDANGIDDLELDESDLKILNAFKNGNDSEAEPGKKTQTLSEMIFSKIQAAKQEVQMQGKENAKNDGNEFDLDPKVIDVYTKVGMIMSRYKSGLGLTFKGPIPKTFKIIPTLLDWEQVLYITNPLDWTPQATYQATRIFSANLKTKMAQRFFNLILLEKVRQDIAETKKLNYHLYLSLKKALYKPAAFFKGFLLPLCQEGDCTLREAAIIGSVLVKVSIPMLHSAVALLKISEMDYNGANSLFIRILLDKKYALPYRVIDSLVFHFLAFKKNVDLLPVLWHQSLLVFAQRYKQDLTPDQKTALFDLIKFQTHHEITEEIRRELINSVCRGEMLINPDTDTDTRMEE